MIYSNNSVKEHCNKWWCICIYMYMSIESWPLSVLSSDHLETGYLMRCCGLIIWPWRCYVHVETWLSLGNYIFYIKCTTYQCTFLVKISGQQLHSFSCSVVISAFHGCFCGVSQLVSGLWAIWFHQFQK